MVEDIEYEEELEEELEEVEETKTTTYQKNKQIII